MVGEVQLSRWTVFSGCLYVAGSCGMQTAYGLLTPSLEGTLHINPSSIALIGAFGSMGSFSGLIAGFIIEYLGSNLALYFAATCVWFGLFCIWLTVVGLLPFSIPSLCIFLYIAQLGASTTSQTSSSTSLSIFPSCYRNKIASIAKGYSGIAGAIISAIAGSYFQYNPNLFILFVSIFIPLSIFAGSFVIPDIPEDGADHFKDSKETMSQRIASYYYHFIILLLLSILTASLSLYSSFQIEDSALSFSLSLDSSLALPIMTRLAGGLIVLWLSGVFFIPKYLSTLLSDHSAGRGCQRVSDFCCCQNPYLGLSDSSHSASSSSSQRQTSSNEERNIEMKPRGEGDEERDIVTPPWSSLPPSYHHETGGRGGISSRVCRYPDYDVTQMIQTREFWLIFIVQSIHFGGTLLVINLIEPISTSFQVKFTSFSVFLIGCSSSIGRISSGHLLEFLSSCTSDSIGPERLMGFCCLSVSVLNLIYSLYISTPLSLYILLSLTGYFHGIMGVLSASSVVSMFGVGHVATNDGVYDLSGAVGSYLIAYGVIALLVPPEQDDSCVGESCYQNCFYLTSFLCLIGFILSLFIRG